MSYFHLTAKSSNRKTGDIPVSTSSSDTCPSCPLKGNGCYAAGGGLHFHWKKVDEGKNNATDWQTFLQKIRNLKPGQLWRHNQAGDLPGNPEGYINPAKVNQLILANQGRKGFTYTHHNVLDNETNAWLVLEANKMGFTINVSANTIAEADKLKKLDVGPVVVTLPWNYEGKKMTTPMGNEVVTCPSYHTEDLTCATCKLCAISSRETIIGFPAHGIKKREMDNDRHFQTTTD